MKKRTFLASMLAAVSASLMTGCYSNDDNEQTAPQASIVESSTNVLLVSSNVEATFTFDGQTQKGTEAEFTTNKVSGTVTVTANGCISQEAEVRFSDDRAALLEFTMVAASANQLSQSEARGKTVENDDTNQKAIGVTAAIEVPSTIGISENTTSPFSVTAYQPAGALADENTGSSQQMTSPVMVLDCTPDGAVFDTPVKVSLEIDDAEGCEFVCPTSAEGTKVTVKGNKLTAEVKHFSEAKFNMVATLTPKGQATPYTRTRAASSDIEESDENPIVPLTAGTQTVDVLQSTGYESNVKENGAKDNFLKSTFGDTGYMAKETEIVSNSNGYARVSVTQQAQAYDITSGSANFTATAYEKAEMKVEKTASASPTVVQHSGGSSDGSPTYEQTNELLTSGVVAALPTAEAITDVAVESNSPLGLEVMAAAIDEVAPAVPALKQEINVARAVPLKKVVAATTIAGEKTAILKYNRWYKIVKPNQKAIVVVCPKTIQKQQLAKLFRTKYKVKIAASQL